MVTFTDSAVYSVSDQLQLLNLKSSVLWLLGISLDMHQTLVTENEIRYFNHLHLVFFSLVFEHLTLMQNGDLNSPYHFAYNSLDVSSENQVVHQNNILLLMIVCILFTCLLDKLLNSVRRNWPGCSSRNAVVTVRFKLVPAEAGTFSFKFANLMPRFFLLFLFPFFNSTDLLSNT